MKYRTNFLRLIAFVTFFYHSAIAEDEPRLVVVSLFDALIEIYQKIRNEDRPADEDAPDLLNTKTNICKDLMSSEQFKKYGYKYIDPKDVFSTSRAVRMHSDTFRELYRQQTSSNSPKPGYEYVNAYATKVIRYDYIDSVVIDPTEERRPLNVGNYKPPATREYVFLCLSTDPVNKTDDFRKWYVSKPYNVNENEDFLRKGRFVFSFKNKSFDLAALAEEPSKDFVSPTPLELLYLDMKENNRQRAKSNMLDPLCRLARGYGDTSRICGIVLSSVFFANKVRSLGGGKFYKSFCFLVEVVFQTPNAVERAGDRRYWEWMTTCMAESLTTGMQVQFYVSRAYQRNTMLVFEAKPDSEGKAFLVNVSTHVIIQDNGK